MSAPLAAILASLADQHAVTVVEFGINLNQREDARYSVCLHWKGFAKRGIACVQACGATPEAALTKAIASMQDERRQPVNLSNVELEIAA